MAIPVVQAALEAIKKVADLSIEVTKIGDPDKYTSNVEKLHEGVSDSYRLMREIIEKDETLTSAEKLRKLEKIARDEAKAKKEIGKELDDHRERTAKVVLGVFSGFLTCGLSFTPAIIRSVKKAIEGDGELPDFAPEVIADAVLLEEAEPVDDPEEDQAADDELSDNL